MKKIPTIFERDYTQPTKPVIDKQNPEANWVFTEPHILPTRKFDGTCCLIKDGILYKRYDAKKGKTPPVGFIPAQEQPDSITGHWPGWIKVDPILKDNKYHVLAQNCSLPDGTYELCGPKIQSNPEHLDKHILIKHGSSILDDSPMPPTFDKLKSYLKDKDIEGIVYYSPDGRMAKIKKKDFFGER